jgi:hypothetical protein
MPADHNRQKRDAEMLKHKWHIVMHVRFNKVPSLCANHMTTNNQ